MLLTLRNVSDSSKSEKNELSQKEALIQSYYGDISKKQKKAEEIMKEPLVTIEMPTPVEVTESEQVVELEESQSKANVTFLNRFMKKLGEFVDGVE